MILIPCLLLASVLGSAQSVRPQECFPIESLGAEERRKAEELFLKILDGEGLYTVIGGIKPMSGGFVSFRGPVSALEFADADEARRLLETFRCGGELEATVHHFARSFPNEKTKQMERYFEGVVFHRGALRGLLKRESAVFAAQGITEHTSPMEALMSVEFGESSFRFRGLGLLFGYPKNAVEFFVGAAEEQARGGKFVERDFVGSPTFARSERGVVYAVPKGYQKGPEDEKLASRMGAVLAEYRGRREKFIGEGKAGVVAMLRDWFCVAEKCQAPQP